MANDNFSEKEQQLASFLPGESFRHYVARIDSTKFTARGYHADYKLLDEEKRVLGNYSENCFGNLPRYLYSLRDKNPRYICYTVVEAAEITKQDMLAWAALGRKIGLLPSDQTPQEIIKEPGITLDLEETTVPRLYMQLCWVRWLREGPGIVKHSLQLVNGFGCDPWAAVAYTHKFHIRYLDQSLLPYGNYRVSGTPVTAERDASYIIQLHWLMNNSSVSTCNESYKRVVLRSEGTVKWNWNTSRIIPKKRIVLRQREMLLSPLILPIISCSEFHNVEDAAAQLNNDKDIEIEEIACNS